MADYYKNSGKGKVWLFLLIWGIIYFFDTRIRLMGSVPLHFPFFIAYLALIFLAWALLLTEHETENLYKYIRDFGIVSAISFFVPWFNHAFIYLPFNDATVALIGLVIIFSPMWMVYLGLLFDGERQRYTRIIGILFVIFWVGFTGLYAFDTVQELGFNAVFQGVFPPLAMDFVWDRVVDNAYDALGLAKKQVSLMWDLMWGRIEYAIDPHKARVDEMNKRKIGVFVEELKPIPSSIFNEGIPVSVEGRIKADVVENEIGLRINCESDGVKGKLYPPQEVWKVVRLFDQRIDCTFNDLASGSHNVEMKVSIEDFETLSYLRGFFLNQEALYELRRQGKDPLRVYDFRDGDFIAVHTPGPLRVSMDVGSPPIGLDSSKESVDLKLDVGLTNVWLGTLKKIKKIFFVVPNSFQITGITGLESKGRSVSKTNCASLPEGDRELCDDGLENVYQLTVEGLNSLPQDLEGGALLFSLRIKGDVSEILKNQPYTTLFFKTNVVYDYELSKKTQVAVRKSLT